MKRTGKDVSNKTGNGNQSSATSCPAPDRGDNHHRPLGAQRRLDAYCVVWRCSDGDSRFHQCVAATSVREAERRSKEEIQTALGPNAKFWKIDEIRIDAPAASAPWYRRTRSRPSSNLFRRIAGRCLRGAQILIGKLPGF
ncbi:MAG: hypothetical protein WA324_11690 [Bryobacteraceae bacterium]